MSNNTANVVQLFRNSSKYPIRFDRLHAGSYFKIVDERSRGIRLPVDDRMYKKAEEHEGFYATRVSDQAAVVLMPEDMVQPMTVDRPNRGR